MNAASDIATDPAAAIIKQEGARTTWLGERGGIQIIVVTDGIDIITAYPAALPYP